MMADGDSDELGINIDDYNDADLYHMDTSMCECNGLVMQIGKVVSDLRSLGFTSMAEDAYSFAIFLLLKVRFI
jgi:anaphase-promoting complex subunit 2